MKKTIILFMLIISAISFGQDDTNTKLSIDNIEDKDGYFGTPLLQNTLVKFKDGNDNLVDVKTKLISKKEQFDVVGIDQINRMYTISNEWIKMKMKNPYSYIPKEISLMFNEKYNVWSCLVKYVAKNSYGGEVAGTDFFTFPNEIVYKPYTIEEYLALTKKVDKENKKKKK